MKKSEVVEIRVVALVPNPTNTFQDSKDVCWMRTAEGEVYRSFAGGAFQRVWPWPADSD